MSDGRTKCQRFLGRDLDVSLFSFPCLTFGVVVVGLVESQDSHCEPVEDKDVNVAMLYDHRRWNGKIPKVAAASAVCAAHQILRELGDRRVYVGNVFRQFVRIFHIFRDPLEFFFQER